MDESNRSVISLMNRLKRGFEKDEIEGGDRGGWLGIQRMNNTACNEMLLNVKFNERIETMCVNDEHETFCWERMCKFF